MSAASVYAGENLVRIPATDWKPGSLTPKPEMHGEGVRFPCPFPKSVDRHVWDARWVGKSLDAADGVEFFYELENAGAFRGVTWYFRAGTGWYAAALPLREGFQRAWIPRDAFEAFENPDSWKKVQATRLSPWTARRGAGAVILYGFVPREADIGVIRPGELSSPDPAERAYGERAATAWLNDLTALGLYPIRVEERAIRDVDPDKIRILILPLNPYPSEPLLQSLERYVKRGGRLVVVYNADPRLGELLGVMPGRWISADLPGRWSRLRFVDPEWVGPSTVSSATVPHLLPPAPAPGGPARTVAVWENAAGRQQPEAAIVASPRSLWFSYFPSSLEDGTRERMLAFLLSEYMPDVLPRALERLMERARRAAEGEPALAALASAEAAVREKAWSRAWDELERARRLSEESRSARIGIPRGIPLGIWDHGGAGLYPGNWDATMAELSACGFTDVFVIVPRDAPRPGAAVRAAEPYGIRVHAWHTCFNHDISSVERERAMRHAQWLQRSRFGTRAFWFCPSRPEARASELERLVHLARTPGIAGVHLDYIRFPDADHCYCDACRASFSEHRGAPVERWPDEVLEGPLRREFLDWRAGVIESFVREVSEAVRAVNPAIRLSAAVWPDVDRVGDDLGQRWDRWIEAGWLDFVAPMSYTERVGELEAWTKRHAAIRGAAGKLWAGIGVRSSHSRLSPAETLAQIRAAVNAGARGAVLFDLNPNVQAELFPVLKAIRAESVNGDPSN